MKQGSAFPYISYAVARPARIGFSLMTHCICHERGTRFNAVPGLTPNTPIDYDAERHDDTITEDNDSIDKSYVDENAFCGNGILSEPTVCDDIDEDVDVDDDDDELFRRRR
jgi:hypothetical protein